MTTQTEGVTASTEVARRSVLRDVVTLDRLTLLAIGVVVALVSIPRLRGFALRENELDAMRMLRALATQPAPADHERLNHDLAALVAHDIGLCRRLEDLEFMEGGRLRRHGYLFDLSMQKAGEPMLRAWPWDHGTTGRGAFVWTPQRGLLGTPNDDGRFTGPDNAPSPTDVDGSWLAISYRR